jgi:sorting nexin-29
LELIKYGGRKLWNRIHQLIKIIWETEQMPKEWGIAIRCLIYKQGDKLECHNYCGITLLNVTYKIFTNLLTRYTETYVDEILGEYQCGFQKGRSTTDQIFCLRMILEKACEYKVDIHQLYIDYKQAYDTINRAELVEIMKEFEISMKLVRLVRMTLTNTNSKVKIQGKLSLSFETTIGLRQGGSLSTLLFNLYMERIIRNVRINPGGTIFNRTRQCLAYADDVVILGRTEGYIKRTLEEMAEITQQIGLQMNDTKTKYMINRQDGNKVKEIELMGKRYEKAESFKYLGAVMTSLNEIETEIKSKTAVGNKCYYVLGPIINPYPANVENMVSP